MCIRDRCDSGLHKIPGGEFYLNRCAALLNMYLMATYGEGKYVETYHNQQIYLNLATVYNLATVRVNGVDCGTIWTAPYRADITGALKKGINELEIEVTNTWANALTGADEGKAPFDGIWTNAKYRRAEKTLLPAGLLGPLSFSTTE